MDYGLAGVLKNPVEMPKVKDTYDVRTETYTWSRDTDIRTKSPLDSLQHLDIIIFTSY